MGRDRTRHDGSERPRVVDPDTGQTLSAAEPSDTPRAPVPRPSVATASALALAVALGAGGGIAWQRHRDAAPGQPVPGPASSPTPRGPATTTPPAPLAAVAGAFRTTATGFAATVRVTLPVGEPATTIAVTVVPMTPDPPPTFAVAGGQSRDVEVLLTPTNACFRSQTWNGIPTVFTVQASGVAVAPTTVVLPYGLYRAIIHSLDVRCPAGS